MSEAPALTGFAGASVRRQRGVAAALFDVMWAFRVKKQSRQSCSDVVQVVRGRDRSGMATDADIQADKALQALLDTITTTLLGDLAEYPPEMVIAEELSYRTDLVDTAERAGCVTVGELSQHLLLMAVRSVAVSRLCDEALGKVLAMFSEAVQEAGECDCHPFAGAAKKAYEDLAIAAAERDFVDVDPV